jgi:hypothetical protein
VRPVIKRMCVAHAYERERPRRSSTPTYISLTRESDERRVAAVALAEDDQTVLVRPRLLRHSPCGSLDVPEGREPLGAGAVAHESCLDIAH